MRIIKITVLLILFILIAGLSAYLTLTRIIKSENSVIVPAIVGKDVVYALGILTDIGLNTKVKGSEYSPNIPKNHVIFQDPESGTEIKKGRDVRIIISKGTKTILMPNLKGLTIQQAQIILEENGLQREEISLTHSKSVRKDEIIAQDPSNGFVVERGERVALLVSMGTRPVAYKMPDLKGLPLEEAIFLIEKRNLLLGEVKSFLCEDKPENIILSQEPLSGYRVIEGRVVNLVINRKPGKKGAGYLHASKGVSLFTYRLKHGFLKRHIKVKLNCFGVSNNIFDDFMKPGSEIWLVIPNNDATVLLYEDDKLIKTQVFDSW